MYLTVKETAEYLSIPENVVEKLIRQKRVKALFDGTQYLVNQSQFDTHLKQVEKYKEIIEEYLSEPIPEDRDIKDED